MNHKPFSLLRHLVVAGTAVAMVAACTADRAPSGEPVATTSAAVFTNGSFETGAAGAAPMSWTVAPFLNPDPGGVTVQTPETRAGLNLAAGGKALTTTIAATNQPDPDLGATASLRVCRYGAQCARVNFHSSTTYGNGNNVNSLSQTMTVAAGDVDPTDGKVHVRFVVAPVLQNPVHAVNEQPYYFVQLTDVTTGAILYTDFNLSAQPGVAWKTVMGGTANEIDYTDWALVDITPANGNLAMGDSVKLEVIAGGCSLGGHFGEIYVDGVGATLPGLYVSGTGPAEANAGTNITYTLTYKNGAATAETGAIIDFTIPPNTTFQAITPPTGATCVTPAVGGTGTIVCTFAGAIAAGATGSLTITVNIDAAATGTIVAGTYDIHSTQETALTGNKITTEIGCLKDTDCPTGDWCKEAAPSACTPTLANGTAVPTDGPHTNPTLNGTCTAAAGTLVCTSTVCDTADNKCGYANGDGPCTAATGPKECRSGACSTNGKCEPAGGCNVDADCAAGDWCAEATHTCTPQLANGKPVPTDGPHTNPTLNGTCTAAAGILVCVSAVCDTKDNECGYANGDGPCTVASGTTVCRSAACSTNGTCEPAGGCNVDADCVAADWCAESTHTCTPKLANGTAVATDPAHTNPTLNGTCTAAAGALVCASAVCDTKDNECGYANGDGPCTLADGGTVCRSGTCSSTGVCIAPSTCNVDADCAAGHWCDETAHTCAAQLANGSPVPTDGPHTNPTLNGTCTVAAGTLVCTSGVCDTKDNECGYANGDGPCTTSDGTIVCRSGACSTNGTCEPAGGCNTNADCTDPATPDCNTTTHTCQAVPDAGTDAGGKPDAGADSGEPTVDAAAEAAAEAGADGAVHDAGDATAADATAPEEDAGGDGFVEGGGCAVGRTTDAPPPVLAGLLLALGMGLGARRRRRVG